MPALNYKNEYERYKKYYLSLEPKMAKPANRAYTAIILSFLTVSLFGWYALRPTMQTIFTLKREITDRTDINAKMEDKISALIEAQAAFDNISGSLPLLSQALPGDTQPVRAVAQLQGLAHDTNVTITGISVQPVSLTNTPGKSPQPAANSSNFPLSITVAGKYTDVKNFIFGIQNLRRIMSLDSIAFSLKKESASVASGSAIPVSTGTSVQVELKLKVFYLSS